ncbi:hypothetical protein FRX31_004855, partial [Thalictrum thalictroides]
MIIHLVRLPGEEDLKLGVHLCVLYANDEGKLGIARFVDPLLKELDDVKICVSRNELVFEVRHGGYFETKPLFRYRNGEKVPNYVYNINPKTLTYYELKNYIDGLGYKDITKIHYCERGRTLDSLRLLVDDENIKHLAELAARNGGYCGINVYTEHGLEEDNVTRTNDNVESGSEEEDTDNNESDLEDCQRELDYENEVEEEEDSDVASVDCSDDELATVRLAERDRKLGKKEKKDVAADNEGVNVKVDASASIQGSDMEFNDNERDMECSDNEGDETILNMKDEDGYDAEYDSPGAYDSLESESEEDEDVEQPKRKKKKKDKFPIWDPNRDPFTFELELCMRLANCEELKDCLRAYAVKKGKFITFRRSGTQLLEAICAPGCPWMLWATWMQ